MIGKSGSNADIDNRNIIEYTASEGERLMSTTNINISIDSEVEAQAQSVLALLGMDMTEAVDLLLRQMIRQQSIPFGVAAPMEEFADYM